MHSMLLKRLQRASKVWVPNHSNYTFREIVHNNRIGWAGFAASAAALSVAIFMHQDASNSGVECKSSHDRWWMMPNIEKRGHYALLKELGRGGPKYNVASSFLLIA